MEFDGTTTAAVFVVLIAVGVGGLYAMDVMAPTTLLTMVLPSMAIFGVVVLAIGVKYGEYRATH